MKANSEVHLRYSEMKVWLIITFILYGIPLNTFAQRDIPFSEAEIETLSRSVVQLLVARTDGSSHQGSGVLVSPEGVIFTAAHVVENAFDIRIAIFDTEGIPPQLAYTGRVQYISSLLDFAVVEIVADINGQSIDPSNLNLPYIEQWSTVPLIRLENIYVWGYPAISSGLSSTDGTITGVQDNQQGIVLYETGAIFATGGSGGLITNAKGEYVGIPIYFRTDVQADAQLTTFIPLSTICEIETEVCVYQPETEIATTPSPNISNSCIEQEWNYAQPPYEQIEIAAIEGCEEIEHYLASLWWAELIELPAQNGIYPIGSGSNNTEIVFVQPSNTIQRIAYRQPMGGHIWRHINFSDDHRLEDATAHATRLVERTPSLRVYVISLPEALENTAVQNLITCISPSMYNIPSC